MKHLFLAVALLGTTATTALAQGNWPPPPTAAQSQAGKQSMIAKTNDLENNLKANKMNKAEDDAADVLKMMKNRVAETRYMAEATSGTQKDALIKRMLMLEDRVFAFMKDIKDVPANGTSLVAQARTFTGDY
jgi:ABC-type arginine transport system ATPase subunit